MSLVSCHCSTPQSAQRELNSRLLHGKQMGYHYTMGAILNCQIVKDHSLCVSPLITTRLFSHAVRRNVLSFQVGSEGLEPSPPWLRATYAAANTLIPFVAIGVEGIEPSARVL